MTNNEAFELTDVETLVMKLVASDRDYWAKTAQSLLRGVVLHLGYQEGRVFTLEQVALALARPVDELCQELIKSEHPMVAAAGREMKQRSATERASVQMTA